MAENTVITLPVNLDFTSAFSSAERNAIAIANRFQRPFNNLTLNDRGILSPLGRITAKANEFSRSLDASTSRVLAFGATTSVLFAIEQAFVKSAKAMIDVQKVLTEINVVLGASSGDLAFFGNNLFEIAKKTGTTFAEVSSAAKELSRQGLGLNETLKRTADVLTLSKLSGLSAVASTEALTAAINSFNKSAITSGDIVNKLARVDANFAVSSADLAESIKRSGAVAQDFNVSLDELIGLTTAAQQITARGGPVIGNALKSIFTKIKGEEVINQLRGLGASVVDMEGKLKPGIEVLKELAKVINRTDLSEVTIQQIEQLAGGIYQINQLKAVLGDLNSQYSITTRATQDSASATDEATKRIAAQQKTIAALVNTFSQSTLQISSKVAELTLGPSANLFLGDFLNPLLKSVNESGAKSEAGESVGKQIGESILKGIGTFIKGPGFILIGTTILGLLRRVGVFAFDAFKNILSLTQGASKVEQIQSQVNVLLSSQPDIQARIAKGQITINELYAKTLSLLQEQTFLQERTLAFSGSLAKRFATSGDIRLFKNKTTGETTIAAPLSATKSEGYIPQKQQVEEKLGALRGGYTPGDVKNLNIPGLGNVIYNNAERVRNFPGLNQPAIIPPKGSLAGQQYQKEFIKTHDFDPYQNKGFVPNFINPLALNSLLKSVPQIGKLVLSNAKFIPKILSTGEVPQDLQKDLFSFFSNAPDYIKSRESLNAVSSISKVLFSSQKSKDFLAQHITNRVGVYTGFDEEALNDIISGPSGFKNYYSYASKKESETKKIFNLAVTSLVGGNIQNEPAILEKLVKLNKNKTYSITSPEVLQNIIKDLFEGRFSSKLHQSGVQYTDLLGQYQAKIFNKSGQRYLHYKDRFDVDLHPAENQILDEYFQNPNTINSYDFKNRLTKNHLKTYGTTSNKELLASLMQREVVSKIGNPITFSGLIKYNKGLIPNFATLYRGLTNFSFSDINTLFSPKETPAILPKTKNEFLKFLSKSIVTTSPGIAPFTPKLSEAKIFSDSNHGLILKKEIVDDNIINTFQKLESALKTKGIKSLYEEGSFIDVKATKEGIIQKLIKINKLISINNEQALSASIDARAFRTGGRFYKRNTILKQGRNIFGEMLKNIHGAENEAEISFFGRSFKKGIDYERFPEKYNLFDTRTREPINSLSSLKTTFLPVKFSETKDRLKNFVKPISGILDDEISRNYPSSPFQQKFDPVFGDIYPNKNKGLIPNFNQFIGYSSPLSQAIEREKSAGISESLIRVSQNQKLRNSNNPLGLGVFNTKDEPAGINQGINRYESLGLDPTRAGIYSKGKIPNFADAVFKLESFEKGSNILEKVLLPELNKLLNQIKSNNSSFSILKPHVDKLISEFNLTAKSSASIRGVFSAAEIKRPGTALTSAQIALSTQIINKDFLKDIVFPGLSQKSKLVLPFAPASPSFKDIADANLITKQLYGKIDPSKITDAIISRVKDKEPRFGEPTLPESSGVFTSTESIVQRALKRREKFRPFRESNIFPPSIPPTREEILQSLLQSTPGDLKLKNQQNNQQLEDLLFNPGQNANQFQKRTENALRIKQNQSQIFRGGGFVGDQLSLSQFSSSTGKGNEFINQQIENFSKQIISKEIKGTGNDLARLRNAILSNTRIFELNAEDTKEINRITKDVTRVSRQFSTISQQQQNEQLAKDNILRQKQIELNNLQRQASTIYQGKSAREALKKIEQLSPNEFPAIKQQIEQTTANRRQNVAFLASFLIPQFTEAVSTAIGDKTLGQRRGAASASALGTIASTAATGAFLTGGSLKGTLLGTGIGLILSIPNLVKKWNDNLPELEKYLERITSSTGKTIDALSGFIQIQEKLDNITTGRITATKGQVARLESEQIGQLSQLNESQRNEFSEAFKTEGTKGAIEFLRKVSEEKSISEKASFLVDLNKLGKENFVKPSSTFFERLPRELGGGGQSQFPTFSIKQEFQKNVEDAASSLLINLKNAQTEEPLVKFLINNKTDVNKLGGLEGESFIQQLLETSKSAGVPKDVITHLGKELRAFDSNEIVLFIKELKKKFDPKNLQSTSEINDAFVATRKAELTVTEKFSKKLFDSILFLEAFNVSIDNLTKAEIQRLSGIRDRQRTIGEGFIGFQENFAGPQTIGALRNQATLQNIDLVRTTGITATNLQFGSDVSKIITQNISQFSQKLQEKVSTGEIKGDTEKIIKAGFDLTEGIQTQNEEIQKNILSGDTGTAKTQINDLINSLKKQNEEIFNQIPKGLSLSPVERLKEEFNKLTIKELNTLFEQLEGNLEKVNAEIDDAQKLQEIQNRQLQDNIEINKRINFGGGIESNIRGLGDFARQSLSARSSLNRGGNSGNLQLQGEGAFGIAELLSSVNANIPNELKDIIVKSNSANIAQKLELLGVEPTGGISIKEASDKLARTQFENKFKSEENQAKLLEQLSKFITQTNENQESFNDFVELSRGKGIKANIVNFKEIKEFFPKWKDSTNGELNDYPKKEEFLANQYFPDYKKLTGISPEFALAPEIQTFKNKLKQLLKENKNDEIIKLYKQRDIDSLEKKIKEPFDIIPQIKGKDGGFDKISQEIEQFNSLIETLQTITVIGKDLRDKPNPRLTEDLNFAFNENKELSDAEKRNRLIDILAVEETDRIGDNLSTAKDKLDTLVKSGTAFTDELIEQNRQIVEMKIRLGEFDIKDVAKNFRDTFKFSAKDFQRDFSEASLHVKTDIQDSFKDAFKSVIIEGKGVTDALRGFGISIASKLLDKTLDISTNFAFDAIGRGIGGLGSAFGRKGAKGGFVRGYSPGGLVKGGSGTEDDVPALLQSGEYVINKSAVQKVGLNNLENLNKSSGVNVLLSNQFDYNDPKRPSSGKFNVSPDLSIFGQTDENNPQNQVKFQREQNFYNYIKDLYDYNKEKEKSLKDFEGQKRNRLIGAAISAAIVIGGAGIQRGIGGSKMSGLPNKQGYFGGQHYDYGNPYTGGSYGYASTGGFIKGYAMGGNVFGGQSVKDNIPVMLTNGEYVIKKDTVDKFGKTFFDNINAGKNPRGYTGGGLVNQDYGINNNTQNFQYNNRIISLLESINVNFSNNRAENVNQPNNNVSAPIVNITNNFNMDRSGNVTSDANVTSSNQNDKNKNNNNEKSDQENLQKFGDLMRNITLQEIIKQNKPGGLLNIKYG